ncbi:MAG: hypothetical protein IJX36_06710, partial [Thermoguttaceae bacterium]|nr:hypothetical protein [Thermoguttaceae bacterium]
VQILVASSCVIVGVAWVAGGVSKLAFKEARRRETAEETATAVKPTRLTERGRSDSNLFNDMKLRRG